VRIRLKLHGTLGFISAFKEGKETEVDFLGNTLENLVNHLLSKMKSGEKRLLLDEREQIQHDVLVFLNQKIIPVPEKLSQLLNEGDLVEFAVFSG
jgi:hypothetical protein